MKADLIERLRTAATGPDDLSSNVSNEFLREAADRIAALEAAVYEHKTAADAFEACWKDAKAALEAEASEGERRGLERAAEVAEAAAKDFDNPHNHSLGVANDLMEACSDIASDIRALIPEAPAREGE